MQDIIQRSVVIQATKESIYDAIAHPERVVSWFPDRVEGTFGKGEQPILDFGDDANAEGWDPMMRRLETCLRTIEAGVS